MPLVTFQNADATPVFKGKAKLKKLIPEFFSDYKLSLESLTVVFCSDEYLLVLNRQFLQHDYYTDILTFDLGFSHSTVGEIYISIDRVKENAFLQNVSFQDELLRIIFHGVLHLCGFGDKTSLQKKKMTDQENQLLTRFAAFHVKQ